MGVSTAVEPPLYKKKKKAAGGRRVPKKKERWERELLLLVETKSGRARREGKGSSVLFDERPSTRLVRFPRNRSTLNKLFRDLAL